MDKKAVIIGCVTAFLVACLTLPAVAFNRVSPALKQEIVADPTSAIHDSLAYGPERSFGLPSSHTAIPQEVRDTYSLSEASLGGTISDRYGIPSYSHLESPVTQEELAEYQMVRKAAVLGVDETTLSSPMLLQESVEESVLVATADALGAPVHARFEGSTSAELQDFVDTHTGKLIVLTNDVEMQDTVNLPSATAIDGAGHILNAKLNGAVFSVQDAENVALCNLQIEGSAEYGLVAENAKHVVLQECTIGGMQSKAVVFAGACRAMRIEGCDFSGNKRGGIIFAGDCELGLVRDSVFSHNEGCSNLMAGVVLSQVELEDPFDLWKNYVGNPPHWPKRDSIEECLGAPHDIVLSGNRVEGNQSSGVYCDGAYRCFLDGNTIASNDKEGMCLDYGTIACYVHGNSFKDNGRRIRQTSESLKMDAVSQFGSLDDGSSVAKLPGVSLDNALYNVVEGNQVEANWGGGIKCVRTAVRNSIVGNVVLNCNMGANDTFDFIGIEVGNAIEENPDRYMDFKPDLENIVVGNYIIGNHFIGIFLSRESAGNLVDRNVVEGAWRGCFVDISNRENTMQRDLLGTAARAYDRLRETLRG